MWNMKPVSYQGMPPPFSGGYPPLDYVPSVPNVMRCEKCGFASTDVAAFKKHMNDHAGTRFYCFYCNNVSFSEAELNAHLKQHTESYPFKCPHCGQGYMRWLCLVKHVDRLHSNGVSFGHAKQGTGKLSQAPVSSASSSVPTLDLSSHRPVVRVKVPASSAPAFILGKEKQRGETLDADMFPAPGGNNAERLSPSNGFQKQNRALTVPLPEEVSIPAGCSVELVEVKTVNGTKELKLRLIAQQGDESAVKGTRTAVFHSVAPEEQLLPTLSRSNILKSATIGRSLAGRKASETATANVEHPGLFPAPLSQRGNSQIRFKRNNQEVINLDYETAASHKVPKILNPAREGSGGVKGTQKDTIHRTLAACPPGISVNRGAGTLSPQHGTPCVSQRRPDERKNPPAETSNAIPTAAAGSDGVVRDARLAVKREPSENDGKDGPAPARAPLPAASKPPSVLRGDPIANLPLSVPKPPKEPPFKTPALVNGAGSKTAAWSKAVRSEERAESRAEEPEHFPVISSVFSLSQQSEDAKETIRPLVMALRGMVMDKSTGAASSSPATDGAEQVQGGPAPESPDQLLPTAQIQEVDEPDRLSGNPAGPPGKVRVKKEKECVKMVDGNERDQSSGAELPKEKEPICKVGARTTQVVCLQVATSEDKVPSKFLTVSLRRVPLGVWKKNKSGLKLRLSKYKTRVSMSSPSGRTLLHTVPLKVDQAVTRAGPNQPVVVLNHPRPRCSARSPRAAAPAGKGAAEMGPKCQILKMRLSKVMGQKYEVLGCTVGDVS